MAEMLKTVAIKVKPKLTVDLETAQDVTRLVRVLEGKVEE